MPKLEDFLEGKPLNERMARLMRGEEDEGEPETVDTSTRNYADGTAITNQDRDQLRRMLASAGWQVLLKLLDTELKHLEDTARRDSVNSPLARKDEIAAAWAELAAEQRARQKIVSLAEAEVEKLKAAKAKKCAIGTTKTPTATS